MNDKQFIEDLNDSQDLANDIGKFIQKKLAVSEYGLSDDEMRKVLAALAIAFVTISKAHGHTMHDILSKCMTVYKHTIVIKD
jgi:pyoverdine/dityrosine biosynthesis protein Dit1